MKCQNIQTVKVAIHYAYAWFVCVMRDLYAWCAIVCVMRNLQIKGRIANHQQTRVCILFAIRSFPVNKFSVHFQKKCKSLLNFLISANQFLYSDWRLLLSLVIFCWRFYRFESSSSTWLESPPLRPVKILQQFRRKHRPFLFYFS